MDVQAAIVAGAGVRPVDSNGNPWQGSYVTASGNLLADVTANANAEMQGRLQVARIYEMTDDHGVRDMLSFLLARDTMHQNQWIRAAQELREEGVEDLPVPSNFPLSNEAREHAYDYINFSDGGSAADGAWASGRRRTDAASSATSMLPTRPRRCRRPRSPTRGSSARMRSRTSSTRRRAWCATFCRSRGGRRGGRPGDGPRICPAHGAGCVQAIESSSSATISSAGSGTRYSPVGAFAVCASASTHVRLSDGVRLP